LDGLYRPYRSLLRSQTKDLRNLQEVTWKLNGKKLDITLIIFMFCWRQAKYSGVLWK